jgi:hypothetical protein
VPEHPRFGSEGAPGNPTGDTKEEENMVTTVEIWTFRDQSFGGLDLIGYHVEALDGQIGKIDEASNAVDASYVVVDTGPWIFGKKVMLPAGLIRGIDQDEQFVYIDCTKDQIKDSPKFDPDTYRDDAYRSTVGSYYGSSELGS